MALFGNLKNKVVQTAQGAAEKTKIMMEVSKVNGLIGEENNRIEENLLRIGEAVYECYPYHVGDAVAERVTQIQASHQKIAEYNKQIDKLKGVVKCKECGTEVESKAFCGNCGASIPVEVEEVAIDEAPEIVAEVTPEEEA